MHRITLTLAALALCLGATQAQVTTSPTPLQQSSQNVVIYYHADEGNKGLINQPASQPIYAHTGVITNTSTSNSDWQYAPSWLDNAAKYKMEYVSENLWKLNIGTINEYYGITDPNVVVKKLAFVFRDATGKKEGKTANGGDIFVDVLEEGLQVSLSSDLSGNVLMEPAKVTFTLSCTQEAALSLSVTLNSDVVASASQDAATELQLPYDFTAYGDYVVAGTATVNGETVSVSEKYSYLSPSAQVDYPGGVPQMGAVRNSDGSVTFCLAAPQKQTVNIVGSWADYQADAASSMNYQDYEGYRYFWTTVPGLEAGKQYMYYYLVDGSTKVGDPYAKLVLDPAFDKYIPASVYPNLPQYPAEKVGDVQLAVYQSDINDYDWKVANFKGAASSDLIIYELLLRDFTGTEGQSKGDGTVRGAIEKIPYLKALGVNAIELLPINEFNGNISWGYNPNFYFAPDKAYGTPDDYKEFIDLCHQNGMAVILDVVFNQTDWQHPWYRMYPAGSNPFYNADAPHAYSVLNDWNQGNPLVRKQFQDALCYWATEYKIDGYRFDLVKGLGDNSSYANNGSGATDAYNATRVANMRALQEALLKVKPDAYFINENLAGAKEENEMAAFGQLNWANINTQGCQYAMGYSDNSALSRFYAPNDSRTWGSTISYLESHDEERLAYAQKSYGATGIKGNIPNSTRRLGCAAAQMILAPGAHMIWQFSEMGNDESTKTSSGQNNTDPKKVLWSYLDNPNRNGLMVSYSELIGLRTANTDLFAKDATFSMACAVSNWENGRTLYSATSDKELITVINPNLNKVLNASVSFRSTDNAAYQIVSKTYSTDPTFDVATGVVTVPANSYVVIANMKVNGVETVESLATPMASAVAGGLWVGEACSVYGADGRLYAQPSGEQTLPLSAGVYVVRFATGTSVKVMVR